MFEFCCCCVHTNRPPLARGRFSPEVNRRRSNDVVSCRLAGGGGGVSDTQKDGTTGGESPGHSGGVGTEREASVKSVSRVLQHRVSVSGSEDAYQLVQFPVRLCVCVSLVIVCGAYVHNGRVCVCVCVSGGQTPVLMC